jgi:hypothetical protein
MKTLPCKSKYTNIRESNFFLPIFEKEKSIIDIIGLSEFIEDRNE